MSKLSKFSDWLVIVCSCLFFMLLGTVIAATLSLLIYDCNEESRVAIFIFIFSGIAVGGKFGDLFGTWLVNKTHNENVKWQSRWIKKEKED